MSTTIEQLKQNAAAIESEYQRKIALAKREIDEKIAEEKTGKIAIIADMIETYQIQPLDLFTESKLRALFPPVQIEAVVPASVKVKKPAPVQFESPNSETWTGRGIQPRWLTALIKQGHDKEEYRVKK
jgi:DNA-binding protein H-NS